MGIATQYVKTSVTPFLQSLLVDHVLRVVDAPMLDLSTDPAEVNTVNDSGTMPDFRSTDDVSTKKRAEPVNLPSGQGIWTVTRFCSTTRQAEPCIYSVSIWIIKQPRLTCRSAGIASPDEGAARSAISLRTYHAVYNPAARSGSLAGSSNQIPRRHGRGIDSGRREERDPPVHPSSYNVRAHVDLACDCANRVEHPKCTASASQARWRRCEDETWRPSPISSFTSLSKTLFPPTTTLCGRRLRSTFGQRVLHSGIGFWMVRAFG